MSFVLPPILNLATTAKPQSGFAHLEWFFGFSANYHAAAMV
jgi:hypothetical protein